MGVKAVWGTLSAPLMSFGSRGDPSAKDRKHYTLARSAAERSLTAPWLVSIGGGAQVRDGFDGRVLELAKVTAVYGETLTFVEDEKLRSLLTQWPVSVVLSEVHSIEGQPRLMEDLGFADRRILANAYDGIIHRDEDMQALWSVIRDLKVERRRDLPPIPGFRDPGRLTLVGSIIPRLLASSEEGKRILRECISIERSSALVKAAKTANRERHGGVIVCEGCDFTSDTRAMFDAHHLDPIHAGVRVSTIDDFAVLCPTCHRWTHEMAPDRLQPLSVAQLREARLGGASE